MANTTPTMTVDEDGDKIWQLNGKLHREDGPAVEKSDGSKEYWLEGKEFSEDAFYQRIFFTKYEPLKDNEIDNFEISLILDSAYVDYESAPSFVLNRISDKTLLLSKHLNRMESKIYSALEQGLVDAYNDLGNQSDSHEIVQRIVQQAFQNQGIDTNFQKESIEDESLSGNDMLLASKEVANEKFDFNFDQLTDDINKSFNEIFVKAFDSKYGKGMFELNIVLDRENLGGDEKASLISKLIEEVNQGDKEALPICNNTMNHILMLSGDDMNYLFSNETAKDIISDQMEVFKKEKKAELLSNGLLDLTQNEFQEFNHEKPTSEIGRFGIFTHNDFPENTQLGIADLSDDGDYPLMIKVDKELFFSRMPSLNQYGGCATTKDVSNDIDRIVSEYLHIKEKEAELDKKFREFDNAIEDANSIRKLKGLQF